MIYGPESLGADFAGVVGVDGVVEVPFDSDEEGVEPPSLDGLLAGVLVVAPVPSDPVVPSEVESFADGLLESPGRLSVL